MDWEFYKQAFEWDGSYREICVFDTQLDDWQRLLDFLNSSNYEVDLLDKVHEAYVLLPDEADAFFAAPDQQIYLLEVNIGGSAPCVLHCRFRDKGEIVFYFLPLDVTGETALLQVFNFMIQLGSALQKDVILTVENVRDWALFRYDVASGTLAPEIPE